MTRYLLDTNIISNATRPQPSQALMDWLAQQDDADLFVASLTIGEIKRGILALPTGQRRNSLTKWFEGPDGPTGIFAGRVLAFDEAAAQIWAELMAEGVALGRPRNALDMIIAAVALANRCTIVTDNERDFYGLGIVNPTRSA